MAAQKHDSALAKKLGWGNGVIPNYRAGRRIMDNEACIALALEIGCDPLPIIMAADMDRAERAGQHSLWEVFSARMTATAASVILCILAVAGVTAPDNANASVRFENVPFRQ
jgi:hypothetical protein